MRECLGWLTSCENEQSCPQNWLEHPVTDLPMDLRCHVCGRTVSLVDSLRALEALAARGGQGAFPVVPPIALDAHPEVASLEAPPNPEPERFAELPSALEPVRAPTPVPARRLWVCTLASGEAIRIDKDSMVIGRSRACDIVIPSAKVSRQHASITRTGGELWIEDLGSANGVWHDGDKVTRTKIANGDTFTISDETLLFEVR